MLFLVFFAVEKILAQEQEGEQSLILARAEYGSYDKLNISVTGTTISWAGDLRYSSHRHLSELYLGPIVSKWTDDKVRLAVTPGIAFSDNKNQFLYGLKVLYKTAEIGGVETFVHGGFLRSINKDPRAIFFFDGEILRSFKNFKVGVGLGAEQSKEKEGEGVDQKMIYEDRFHLEARFLFPIKKTPLSIIGFVGFVYESHASKTPIFFVKHEYSNNLNVDIGVRYELF